MVIAALCTRKRWDSLIHPRCHCQELMPKVHETGTVTTHGQRMKVSHIVLNPMGRPWVFGLLQLHEVVFAAISLSLYCSQLSFWSADRSCWNENGYLLQWHWRSRCWWSESCAVLTLRTWCCLCLVQSLLDDFASCFLWESEQDSFSRSHWIK